MHPRPGRSSSPYRLPVVKSVPLVRGSLIDRISVPVLQSKHKDVSHAVAVTVLSPPPPLDSPKIPKAAPAVVAEVPKVVSPSRNVVFPEVVASPTSARSHGPDPIPRSTAAATVVSHSKLTYQPLLYSRSGGSTMKFHPVGAEEYAQTVSELKLAKQRQLSCKPRALSAPAGKLHVDSCECDTCTANVLLEARNAALTGPRLFYRMNSSIALIHAIFRHHGFTLTKSDMFNSLWTSGHLKSYVFQGLSPYQKINQFPRSFECTRKDTLARNIRRLQQDHGDRFFPYFPTTFVLPRDLSEMQSYLHRNDGEAWIVKPVASAQGRGIFLTTLRSDFNGWFASADSGAAESDPRKFDINAAVAARYIANPLLIDGCKFDLRLYVAVTSINPLRIYLHEEGLCRFATEPYNADPVNFRNKFMHLTNYSINKKSDKFVAGSDDGKAGHKWSLSALQERLRNMGINVDLLWKDVHDLIIKTFIAIEQQVVAAVDMFVPHKQNCYELFGFDVLIDDCLKPWLLEVNFSPSLACDSPLDLRIKSQVISELFTLVGFRSRDEAQAEKQEIAHMLIRPSLPPRHGTKTVSLPSVRTFGHMTPDTSSQPQEVAVAQSLLLDLPKNDAKLVAECLEEMARCGGYKKIFPCSNAHGYAHLFTEKRRENAVLAAFFHKYEAALTRPEDPREGIVGGVESEPVSGASTTVLRLNKRRPVEPTRAKTKATSSLASSLPPAAHHFGVPVFGVDPA